MKKRIYNEARLSVVQLSSKATLLSGSGESSSAPASFTANIQSFSNGGAVFE